jgi:DmsE family decaheme c-type cytochrome
MNCIQRLAALCALAAAAALQPAAAADQAAVERAIRADAVCTKCHDETESRPVLSIYQTRHGVKADERTPSCQSCHGESERHVKGDGSGKRAKVDVSFARHGGAAAREQVAACMTCHASGKRNHWSGSVHEREEIACSSCHSVHVARDRVLERATQPEVCFQCHKEQKAQVHKISTHPIDAGKMACSDCHNPHGSAGPKLLTGNTVNETCYSCHAEKRGPFLFEHQPVTDDCANCHTPHGANSAPLLKARLPWLCQECHSGDHARSVYSGANLPGGAVTTVMGNKPFQNQAPNAQLVGKQCLNCHSLVHGSNSPAGAKFQR